MTRSRAIENRRQEPRRQYLPRAPVAWRGNGCAVWHRGWLNDASESGASLLVPAEGQPHAGQDIVLRHRGSGDCLLFRVVRTQTHEQGQGLVACRVVSAAGCPAILRPVPRTGRARQAARRTGPVRIRLYRTHVLARQRSA